MSHRKKAIDSGHNPSDCSFYMNVETIGGRNTTSVIVKSERSFNWLVLLLIVIILVGWIFGRQMLSTYVLEVEVANG